jgi:hypothetical protein
LLGGGLKARFRSPGSDLDESHGLAAENTPRRIPYKPELLKLVVFRRSGMLFCIKT